MSGTFRERIRELRGNVGTETQGSVEVDQVYAGYQHFRDDLRHPDGGKAFYLRDPLYANVDRFMEHLAVDTLEDEGNGLSDAMQDDMETLSARVYDEAPWEFADLRASGHPSTRVNGEIKHDRPPLAHRLTEEELRVKKHLSRLFNPDRDRRPKS